MPSHCVASTIAALFVAVFHAPTTTFAGDPACACDCNRDERVVVGELISAAAIALERSPLAICAAADVDGDQMVEVAELIGGVGAALRGCDGSMPLPTRTPLPSQIPPADAQALLTWLQTGNYRDWRAESSPHSSGGPHFGRVRTYVNDPLFDSLSAANTQHPAGAAAVKELYGGSGDALLGWSVSIKEAGDSMGGANWYWYERFNDGVFAAGLGVGICTGCHSQNYRTFTSKDLVLIPFPLQ